MVDGSCEPVLCIIFDIQRPVFCCRALFVQLKPDSLLMERTESTS